MAKTFGVDRLLARASALSLIASMALAPVAGCRKEPPPAVDDSRGQHTSAQNAPVQRPAEDKPGMSAKQKVVVLAGAAALYYLYKRHQNASAKEGPESQYYLSKNGRVYYRDADHRAHWVTPPSQGIQVPETEAAQYREYQGYDNNPAGRDLTGLGTDPVTN